MSRATETLEGSPQTFEGWTPQDALDIDGHPLLQFPIGRQRSSTSAEDASTIAIPILGATSVAWISGSAHFRSGDSVTTITADMASRRLRPRAEREYLRIAAAAVEDRFEDGVFNTVARELPRFLIDYGDTAIEAIRDAWTSRAVGGEVFCETLVWTGRVGSQQTRNARLRFLLEQLASDLPRVRDAAVIGLSEMSDPAIAPRLRAALDREKVPALKATIRQALDELTAQ